MRIRCLFRKTLLMKHNSLHYLICKLLQPVCGIHEKNVYNSIGIRCLRKMVSPEIRGKPQPDNRIPDLLNARIMGFPIP